MSLIINDGNVYKFFKNREVEYAKFIAPKKGKRIHSKSDLRGFGMFC